jgi:hypothetical protein
MIVTRHVDDNGHVWAVAEEGPCPFCAVGQQGRWVAHAHQLDDDGNLLPLSLPMALLSVAGVMP